MWRLRSCQDFQFFLRAMQRGDVGKAADWPRLHHSHSSVSKQLYCLTFYYGQQDLARFNPSKHKKKLHLHLPNLESKLDYYSMSSTNSLWSHLSDFWWTFRGENRVPPYRSSTFKKPSILCSVRDSRVGSDDNEPLAPLLCNPGWDLRGTYKCLWEADISDLFWKGRK